MEASAGAPPRPEDITSRLTQLALQVMEGLNRNQNKYNGTDAVTNGASGEMCGLVLNSKVFLLPFDIFVLVNI